MMSEDGVSVADESDDEEDDSESDDEDEVVFGGYDFENDGDDECEDVDAGDDKKVAERALELFGEEDAWEVALFGRTEDEADHTDAEDINMQDAKVDSSEDEAKTTTTMATLTTSPTTTTMDTTEATSEATTEATSETTPKTIELWTKPEDWEYPIIPLPSTEFDFFGQGYVRATATRTVDQAVDDADSNKTSTPTPTSTRTKTAPADVPKANGDLKADSRTKTADTPLTKPSTDPRTSTDTDRKTAKKPRTTNPQMRTTTAEEPKVKPTQVANTTSLNSLPAGSKVSSMFVPVTDHCRGKKRKAGEDEDELAQEDPRVKEALAKSRSLAGLKFKKVKTCHSILATEKAKTATIGTTSTSALRTAVKTTVGAGVDSKWQTGTKVRWCLDGDQKLPPRKHDGPAGTKRKASDRDDCDDKEDGELSDSGSEDNIPLAKRRKSTHLSRTPGFGDDYGRQARSDIGAQRRWDDRRWTQNTATTARMQYRPQAATRFGW
ncbi:hypothetical protein BD413DRAFT_528738 [Trametes elegans]|nr:hypothetical protein BD413DRAFT_528738 [Trametes elegans]